MREEVVVARLGMTIGLAGALVLVGCVVAPPSGPSVMALPGNGKSFAQFQQEDGTCRQYASQQIGNQSPAQAANNSAVGSAAVGTILGAAAGALLGASGGDAAEGAAIGAGGGLLVGSAWGANAAYASGAALQQRYDMAYVQCMYANGNKLPAAPRPYGGYPYRPYGYDPYRPMYPGYGYNNGYPGYN